METENSLWLFSVSITHDFWLFSVSITYNSKIRELSDGNRVMEIELLFAKQTFTMGPTIFEL